MLPSLRPLLRPLPLIGFGISTSSLLLAATYTSSKQPATMAPASSPKPTTSWATTLYVPRHASWPYSPRDFMRQDESTDDGFYSSPRFVTHIDDAAIASLREYYHTVLPRKGRILDFCSSWISHYPAEVESAADKGDVKVTGMGMNAAELEANKVLNAGRLLIDLNKDADIAKTLEQHGGEKDGKLDASTCVVSIDYLTSPLQVLTSLLSATKVGGTVHLAISNRCFPTKAVGRWLRISEEERLQMVGDYLWFAGWRHIEIVELSDGSVDAAQREKMRGMGGLQGLMSGVFGMGGRDPIWVVRAVKE